MKKILVLLTTMFAVIMTAFPCMSQETDFNKLLEAAKQGNAEAQCYVGACYLYGEGVAQDYAEAVKWFQLAAEQGLPNAQSLMGVCYYYGIIVEENHAEAAKWYKLAAEQGVPNAQYLLGESYFSGDGIQQDYEESVKWFKMAADQGYADAQYILGVIYYEGLGAPKNIFEARMWLKLAASQGHEDAKAFLAKSKIDMPSKEHKEETTFPTDVGKIDDGTEAIPFKLVDVKPSFMGGDASSFTTWVNEHLVYPEIAKKNGVQGRVVLSFTVETDGSVSNVMVLRGVDPILDAEAFRVVSSSPKWTPGKNEGKIVKVTYTFPVVFQLR